MAMTLAAWVDELALSGIAMTPKLSTRWGDGGRSVSPRHFENSRVSTKPLNKVVPANPGSLRLTVPVFPQTPQAPSQFFFISALNAGEMVPAPTQPFSAGSTALRMPPKTVVAALENELLIGLSFVDAARGVVTLGKRGGLF